MIETYLVLIVIGLILDIIGFYFVIKPFLNLFTVQYGPGAKIVSRTLKQPDIRSVQKHAWTGLIFVCLGFLLQIFGNLIRD